MTRLLRYIIFFLIAACWVGSANAQLPIKESFRYDNAPDLQLGGNPNPAILTANNGDPQGNGFLRLTTAATNQTGFARSLGIFPSNSGVKVQFEYYTYDGTGADGISFFLYDGDVVNTFNIGAFGGSLGYAQKTTIPGVSKGFVAIGLDEWGSFANNMEGRGSGPNNWFGSSVVLRGSGDGSAGTAENYEYLTHVQTTNATDMANANAGTTFQIAGDKSPRTGGSGGGPLTSADDGYRKVYMELEPANDLGPGNNEQGFRITVIITENTGGGIGNLKEHKVIDNFEYIPDDGVPETLGYGFAASTGDNVNYHEIRNIEILASSAAPPNAVKDFSKSGKKNVPIPFTAADFYVTDVNVSNFTDPNDDALDRIRIISLPANGVLKLGVNDIDVNDEISYADLGNITYVPNPGYTGGDSFQWNGAEPLLAGGLYSPTPANVNITVLPAPSVIVSNISVCDPASSPLSLSYSNPDEDPVEYKIEFTGQAVTDGFLDIGYSSNNLLALSGAPISIPLPGGAQVGVTYTGNLYVRDASANEGVAIPFTILIKPLAVAADISVSGPSAAVCAGGSATFTPSLVTPGSITTPVYTWYANADKSGGAIVTGGNFTVNPTTGALTVANLSGSVTYYVSVSGTEKCENAANTLQTGSVTVTPLAVAADISVSGPSAAVCAGGSATFTPSLVTPGSITTPVYTWYANADKSGGAIVTGGNFTVNPTTGALTVANLSGSVTYYVSVSGTEKCENAANTLQTGSVTVNPLPNVTAITGTSSISVGANTTWSSTPAGGAWSSGNTAVATVNALSGVITGVSAGTAVITYTVTTNGCSASVNKTITVTTAPVSNTPPVAVADSYSTTKGGTLTVAVPGVLGNDTDADSDPITAIKVGDPSNGTLTLNSNGSFTYIHNGSNTTSDSFTYKVNDGTVDGNTVTVSLTINATNTPPVAVADSYSTTKGGTLTVAVPGVLGNDTDADSNPLTAIKVANPTHGTVTLNSNGSFTYIHNGDNATSDSFTYKVNDGTADGNTVTVSITINATNTPPVVADIPKIGTGFLPIPFTTGDFTSKYTDNENDPLTKIRITSLPPTGTLKLNGVNVTVNQEIPAAQLGDLTFTPAVNWSGTTSFGWNGYDGKTYANSDANVNITVVLPTDPTAKIGVAKKLVSITDGLNGSYHVKFLFTLVNYGQNGLENISLQDNLAQHFAGTEFTVKSVTALGNLQANNAFNGITNTDLLLPASTLSAGEETQVELEINVKLKLNGGLFQNYAFAEGTSSVTGFKVTDRSSNGVKPDPVTAGDVSPFEDTPIELILKPVFVPAGFSPNKDGVNDFFVVQNALNKSISLEIYNRWGNRVYQAKEYRNDWDGRCTEGFFMGRDIPDGTYFYVIVVENKDKYVGYININR